MYNLKVYQDNRINIQQTVVLSFTYFLLTQNKTFRTFSIVWLPIFSSYNAM